MTLLEKICEELGVEVGEEWLGNDGAIYMFDDEGYLHVQCEDETNLTEFIWEAITPTIPRILRGELKPVWKPDFGDEYFYPGIDFIDENGRYNATTWTEHAKDIWRFNNGLVFRTKEEAIEATNKMLNALKEEE